MKPSELQHIFTDRAAHAGTYKTASNRKRKVQEFFRYQRGLQILDVGCGNGELLKEITHQHRIFGVDISRAVLLEAVKNGYGAVSQSDVSTDGLLFMSESFDCVVCGETIEHVVDTDWLLTEINRVLKPAGRLCLTFPNIRTPIGLAMMLLNRPPMFASRYRASHVRDFTTRSIEQALENNGFRVTRMRGADFCLSKSPAGVLPWLAEYLPAWSSTVVVYAKKVKSAVYTVASHL